MANPELLCLSHPGPWLYALKLPPPHMSFLPSSLLSPGEMPAKAAYKTWFSESHCEHLSPHMVFIFSVLCPFFFNLHVVFGFPH